MPALFYAELTLLAGHYLRSVRIAAKCPHHGALSLKAQGHHGLTLKLSRLSGNACNRCCVRADEVWGLWRGPKDAKEMANVAA